MEAVTQFECAYEAYRREPSCENAKILRPLLADHIRERGVPAICVGLAILDVMHERHHSGKRLRTRISIWLVQKVSRWWPKDKPGWNDYFMVRWQLTKDVACAQEIHRRTHYFEGKHDTDVTKLTGENWSLVGWTAQWMVGSQRREDPEFDSAISEAEKACPICCNSAVGVIA